MTSIKKVKCSKGHVVMVADCYPEQYLKLVCEKCKLSYPIRAVKSKQFEIR
jgi:ribosomal protein L7Ae-like RNA K-turn-binding protein